MTFLSVILIALLSVTVIKIVLYRLFLSDVIKATLERDPAATNAVAVSLTYPGIQAIFYYRIGRFFRSLGLHFTARWFSQLGRMFTGIEIHPGAKIGKGFFIDHGMGVVIGETSIIGDNVTMFQGVTLGGTGKQRGKRHPTIGNNVLIGAGAKILGNITIGDNVSVGANAVVIRDVPAHSTVVGVPGRITGSEGDKACNSLDYKNLPDPLSQALDKLQNEIDKIEHDLHDDDKKKR